MFSNDEQYWRTNDAIRLYFSVYDQKIYLCYPLTSVPYKVIILKGGFMLEK